jgi:NAD(P)-dependent dehydrogenase (short-subunit alcohol dehydrogenase family)
MPSVIVIGIGSDIGRELAARFASDGWRVSGTYRTRAGLDQLPEDVWLVPCDLAVPNSVRAALEEFRRDGPTWDMLVVAVGTEEPIGAFWECEPDAWDKNIRINALAPLRIVRGLYPRRNSSGTPCVAFFSGAGTNSAAPAYSAYCASKIFLIKMCELLDAESADTSFFIIGPGIVRTKIHEQTLRAGKRGGANYQKVVDFLGSANAGTSHDDVYACLQWCIDAGKSVIGGRNISLVNDSWRNGGSTLTGLLEGDPNLYKLRRFGNDLRVATKPKLPEFTSHDSNPHAVIYDDVLK